MYIYSYYVPAIKDLPVRAGKTANVRYLPGNSAPLFKVYPQGQQIGISTGRLGMAQGSSFIYIEVRTTQGNYWIEYRNVIYPDGFSKSFNISQIALNAFGLGNYSEKQKEYNELLLLQGRIFYELLAAGRTIQNLQQKGISVNSIYPLYKQISDNYNARQEWIIKNSEKVSPVNKSKLGSLVNLVITTTTGVSLGALPAVPIIIAFTVGVVLTAVAVASLTSKKDEAQVDFDKLPTLQKLLLNVDPKTANEVRNEVQNIANDSFEQGKGSGFFGKIGKLATGVGVGVGAYFLYQIFKQN